MDWTLFAVQWVHVILGIFWFGSTLYSDFVLIPAMNTLPLARQREIGAALGAQLSRLMPAVAGATILMGFLRGTVFGQVKSLDALTTTYGLTWLTGLVAAIATFSWGIRMIQPRIDELMQITDAEALGPDGQPTARLVALAAVLKRNAMLELLGFVVIFTCMILMRFGY